MPLLSKIKVSQALFTQDGDTTLLLKKYIVDYDWCLQSKYKGKKYSSIYCVTGRKESYFISLQIES